MQMTVAIARIIGASAEVQGNVGWTEDYAQKHLLRREELRAGEKLVESSWRGRSPVFYGRQQHWSYPPAKTCQQASEAVNALQMPAMTDPFQLRCDGENGRTLCGKLGRAMEPYHMSTTAIDQAGIRLLTLDAGRDTGSKEKLAMRRAWQRDC